MIKNYFLFLAISVFLMGCETRKSAPIMPSPADLSKSCELLKVEMTNLQSEIHKMLPKIGQKQNTNVVGFSPLAFSFYVANVEDKAGEEYESYKQRYDILASIAVTKKCNFEIDRFMSLKEIKKHYKNRK